MGQTCIIIGLASTCRRVEGMLALMEEPPEVLGWVVHEKGEVEENCGGDGGSAVADPPYLESMVARLQPDLALVSLPGVMADLITQVRTRLRKLGVTDRYLPPLEDQLAGVGPRTEYEIDLNALLDRPPREINPEAMRRVIEGKRVLITGAGGSIGSELSRIVAHYGPEQLVLVERSENALFEIDRQIARLAPALSRKALLHDIVEREQTEAWFRDLRPQVVFHAAAHKHVPMMEDHPGAAVDNNLFGTKSVADAADATGVERFVMISTDKAVNPVSVMGATKRLAELYVQHLNGKSATAFSMVRFGNVLGSSGSVLEIWKQQLAAGGPLTVTDPRMTRYFMTIPEAAALVIQSASLVVPDSRDQPGEVFLLDMGEPVKIVEVAERYIRLHGLVARMAEGEVANEAGSVEIVFSGIRPGEKLFEELAFDAEAMRPTRHADINIWLVPSPEVRYVEAMLRGLSVTQRPGGEELAPYILEWAKGEGMVENGRISVHINNLPAFSAQKVPQQLAS